MDLGFLEHFLTQLPSRHNSLSLQTRTTMRRFDRKSGVTARHEFFSVIVKLSTVWFSHECTFTWKITRKNASHSLLREDLPTEQPDRIGYTFLKRGKFERLNCFDVRARGNWVWLLGWILRNIFSGSTDGVEHLFMVSERM